MILAAVAEAQASGARLENACEILGVSTLRLLGYRDSGMLDTPANQHPQAFCQADPAEAAGVMPL